MSDTPVDYSPVYDFLYRIEKRISNLEKDSEYIERQIISLDGKKSKDFQALSDELRGFQAQISSAKSSFNNCVKAMISLSTDLKNSVKKDDLNSINAQLDEVKFEEYVTQKDLTRGM